MRLAASSHPALTRIIVHKICPHHRPHAAPENPRRRTRRAMPDALQHRADTLENVEPAVTAELLATRRRSAVCQRAEQLLAARAA